MSGQVCPYCNRLLMEIDRYGERLIGCVDCNRWGHPGDKQLIMELPVKKRAIELCEQYPIYR